MPTLKTPLVGSYNQRQFGTTSTNDQRFKACIFTKVGNSATGSNTWYTEKRGGLTGSYTVSAGEFGKGVYVSPSLGYGIGSGGNTFSVFTTSGAAPYSVFRSPPSGSAVNCGSISFIPIDFTETVLSGITYVLFTLSDGTGWYLPSDATATTAYTGDGNNSITITDLKVAGVSSVAGLYVGQKMAAASNIVAGSRIASINAGAFSLTLDTATTGGAFNDLAITKEPIAKIIDADFPSAIGGFAEMDGYIFVMDNTGKLYNSDLNSVSSWSASNYISANSSTDVNVGCVKYKTYIVGLSRNSIEFFYNAGNASGSILSRADQLTIRIGVANSASAVNGSAGGSPIARVVFDDLYFVTPVGYLYKLNGFSPVKLSPQTLNLGSLLAGRLYGTNHGGQTIIHIDGGAGTSAASMWYSTETQTFSQPTLPSTAYMDSNSTGSFVLDSPDTSGKVMYQSTAGSFQDNGAAFTMSIQIQTDMGTNKRKFASELRIEADVQTSGNIAVSWSDDDGTSFSTPINIPLTSIRMRLTGVLGSWEGTRLWKFEDSGNNACRIRQIEIDYEVAK